ncbi:MAG: outer membrane lipoprotein-sorting protein [Deltaproteobacteria bacterium]|nr:outer membrane lipoprotein-sorting protein [Deltaproteobacteria bacterium]
MTWSRRRVLGALAGAAGLPHRVALGSAADEGLAVAREVDRRHEGFGDTRGKAKMILRNRSGHECVRNLTILTREVPDDADMCLIVFSDPADVTGTVLLTHNHVQGDDDQWMYLPALRRVRRISGASRSGPFMGSEFSYEDMTAPVVERYAYLHLGHEDLEGERCHVVERRPMRSSAYSKTVVWVVEAEYRVRRVTYYNRRGGHIKTLDATDYHEYEGRFWRPHRSFLVNHVTGKSTVLQWSDIVYGEGALAEDYHPDNLAAVSGRYS